MPLNSPVSQPVTAGYSTVTLNDALQQLSQDLKDPDNVYWGSDELTAYLVEALHTWQAYTSWFRVRGQLSFQSDVGPWQRIALSGTGGIPQNDHTTDAGLGSVILYHLLESQLNSDGTWAGTGQFTVADLADAVLYRINRFLSDSGVLLDSVYEQNVTASNGRVLIPANILDVRRAAWVTSGVYLHLWRVSEFEANAFNPAWAGTTGPQGYSQALTSPASLQLIPPPATSGDLDLVVVSTRTIPIDFTGGEVLGQHLGVPDIFSWGVKFGAMAELLSEDGEAKDPERAAYCEQRYREAVELSKAFPSILNATIDGQPIFINAVHDLDAFDPDWQNRTTGDTTLAVMGRNLLALVPPPTTANAATWPTINLDVALNIPFSYAGGDYLQVPDDLVPVILGYAQHLAAFKMGGQEFQATMPLFQNMVYEAANYNERLRQLDFYSVVTKAKALEDNSDTPRLALPGMQKNG